MTEHPRLPEGMQTDQMTVQRIVVERTSIGWRVSLYEGDTGRGICILQTTTLTLAGALDLLTSINLREADRTPRSTG